MTETPVAAPTPLDATTERQVAVDLFNHVWTLLETPDRTPMQDDEMLHAAHASRHHWGKVGKPVNLARGEWQCSRVYAVLGRPEPALWHGRRCVALCEEHGIGDFDIAFGWEAIARAEAVAGNRPGGRRGARSSPKPCRRHRGRRGPRAPRERPCDDLRGRGRRIRLGSPRGSDAVGARARRSRRGDRLCRRRSRRRSPVTRRWRRRTALPIAGTPCRTPSMRVSPSPA